MEVLVRVWAPAEFVETRHPLHPWNSASIIKSSLPDGLEFAVYPAWLNRSMKLEAVACRDKADVSMSAEGVRAVRAVLAPRGRQKADRYLLVAIRPMRPLSYPVSLQIACIRHN